MEGVASLMKDIDCQTEDSIPRREDCQEEPFASSFRGLKSFTLELPFLGVFAT